MLTVVATYVSTEAQFPFVLTPGFPLPLIYNSPPVYYHKVEGDQEKSFEKTGCRNNEGCGQVNEFVVEFGRVWGSKRGYRKIMKDVRE